MYYIDPNSSCHYICNEIAISNLFAAINNEKVLSKLDDETVNKLYDILANYTKACVNNIMVSDNLDAQKLRKNIR